MGLPGQAPDLSRVRFEIVLDKTFVKRGSMASRFRDWIVGSISTAKAVISVIFGMSNLFSAFDDGMMDVVEKLVISALFLFGVGLTNIRVAFGWLVDKEGMVMRNRRMTAWKSEMICAGVFLFLKKYAESKKDFNVGHGQEYILLYPVLGVLMLILALSNLIPYGVEKSEAGSPGGTGIP